MFAALARLFASLSLGPQAAAVGLLRSGDGARRRADHQAGITCPGCASTACSAWPSARISSRSPRRCGSICPARWRPAGMRSSAGIFPTPMRPWSRSSGSTSNSCRDIAREVGLDLHDILDERARLWPKLMRWEAAYFILWTRTSVLTKEERKQLKAEYAANAREARRARQTRSASICAARSWRRATPRSRRGCLSALRAHDVAAARDRPARGAARQRARRCIARWPAPNGGRACRATG